MKNCTQCTTAFEITDSDRQFYEKVSPVFGGKKYLIPEPTLCPTCRQIRRLQWRNERHLYRRTCQLCNKPIIAIYSEDKPYTVYCRECWWGDGWEALDQGRDFDFNRPFFDQFEELMQAVPRSAVVSFKVENCEYANYQNDSRNCYLTFGSGFMEDCMYTDWTYYAKNVYDCSFCTKAELDYMNVDCSETYHCQFCQDCKNINDCSHCYDCRDCKNCFGCVGLRNKQYHIFNKPYSKEQYFELLEKMKDPSHKGNILAEIKKLKSAHPHVSTRLTNTENCTGDRIENSKNCLECYELKDGEDCKYLFDVFNAKDSMDINRSGFDELVYEACGGGYYQNLLFSSLNADVSFGQYIFETMYAKHVFGCAGLKHKDYVILNKQYSKQDYEKLVPKIIEHMQERDEWGEFFPPTISPFAYNETLAQEFFPLTKETCVSKGFRWKEPDKKEYQPQTYQVPSDIKDVPDSITQEILACKVTGKNYKITPQELKFYRQEGLPIPDRHPDQRYKDRLALKNPRKLWDRKCDQCQTNIQTTYSPERPEKVYCEQCYLKEIY